MNCKYCKYYTPYFKEVYGMCNNPLMVDDSEEVNECPEYGVYATCDEQRGDLRVGQNFGCIHFKQKESE